jgi:hypothetical protein
MTFDEDDERIIRETAFMTKRGVANYNDESRAYEAKRRIAKREFAREEERREAELEAEFQAQQKRK